MKPVIACVALALLSACAAEPRSDLSQATEALWAANGQLAEHRAQEQTGQRRHLVLGMASAGFVEFTTVETADSKTCDYVAWELGKALARPVLDPALPRLDSVECVVEPPAAARPIQPTAWRL